MSSESEEQSPGAGRACRTLKLGQRVWNAVTHQKRSSPQFLSSRAFPSSRVGIQCPVILLDFQGRETV